MASGEPYPFLFYGVRPKDWYEGLHYIVFFDKELTDRVRQTVVTKLSALLADKRLALAGAPKWESSWMLFYLEQARNVPRAFSAVAEVLRALHASAPIREVVNLSARAASDDRWEEWTLGRQRWPTVGPSFGLDQRVIFYRARSP